MAKTFTTGNFTDIHGGIYSGNVIWEVVPTGDKPPKGYIFIGEAARRAHLDSSRMRAYCRRYRDAAVGEGWGFRCFKILRNSRWKWVIELDSLKKWIKGRNK